LALKDWVEKRRQAAQARRAHAVLRAREDRVRVAEEAVVARRELVELRQEVKDRAVVAELRRERFARSRAGRFASGLSSFAAEAGKGLAVGVGGVRKKKVVPVGKRRVRRRSAIKRKVVKRRAPRRRRSRRTMVAKPREVRNPGDLFGRI